MEGLLQQISRAWSGVSDSGGPGETENFCGVLGANAAGLETPLCELRGWSYSLILESFNKTFSKHFGCKIKMVTKPPKCLSVPLWGHSSLSTSACIHPAHPSGWLPPNRKDLSHTIVSHLSKLFTCSRTPAPFSLGIQFVFEKMFHLSCCTINSLNTSLCPFLVCLLLLECCLMCNRCLINEWMFQWENWVRR